MIKYKGKEFRNIQEQVLENTRRIEDLESRVKTLEEAILPEAQVLYMHNIQLTDAEQIDEASVIVNFSLFTKNSTPFTIETLKDYLYENGYRGKTKFIPAVGKTDDDNFVCVTSVNFTLETSDSIYIERTVIGVCADADDVKLIEVLTDEDTVGGFLHEVISGFNQINDEDPIKIL